MFFGYTQFILSTLQGIVYLKGKK